MTHTAHVRPSEAQRKLVELAAAVRDGGGLWRGVQQGIPERGVEPLVLFDDASLQENKSSSMALPMSEVTPEAVRAQINKMRERFGLPRL